MTKFLLVALACLASACTSSPSAGEDGGGGGGVDGAGSSSSGSSSGGLDDSGGSSSSGASSSSSGGSEAGGSSGSGSSGGSSSGYGLLNCPSSPAFAGACSDCIGSMCKDAVNAVNTACATYFPCLCPLGADAGGCAPSSSCLSAYGMVSAQCQGCAAACNPQADAGSD